MSAFRVGDVVRHKIGQRPPLRVFGSDVVVAGLSGTNPGEFYAVGRTSGRPFGTQQMSNYVLVMTREEAALERIEKGK